MQPYDNLAALGVPSTRILDTVGDASGSIDMRVDGSVTDAHFFLTVPEGHTYLLSSLTIFVQDSPLSATGFGGGAALTNGLDFGITIDSVFTTRIPQRTIKTNSDFATFGLDIRPFIGVGTDAYSAHVNFEESYGGRIKLVAGMSYTVVVQDNLTTYGDAINAHFGYLDITHPVVTP